MSSRNSNVYGVLALLAGVLVVFFLIRRRFRWGFLFMNLVIGLFQKSTEQKELRRIHSILDQVN